MSDLPKTWIIDLDGTVFAHRGFELHGFPEKPLPGVLDFWDRVIGPGDLVIVVSARGPEFEAGTRRSLETAGLRYDRLILGAPPGPRWVVNDRKPRGLRTAGALGVRRNEGLTRYVEDSTWQENQSF